MGAILGFIVEVAGLEKIEELPLLVEVESGCCEGGGAPDGDEEEGITVVAITRAGEGEAFAMLTDLRGLGVGLGMLEFWLVDKGANEDDARASAVTADCNDLRDWDTGRVEARLGAAVAGRGGAEVMMGSGKRTAPGGTRGGGGLIKREAGAAPLSRFIGAVFPPCDALLSIVTGTAGGGALGARALGEVDACGVGGRATRCVPLSTPLSFNMPAVADASDLLLVFTTCGAGVLFTGVGTTLPSNATPGVAVVTNARVRVLSRLGTTWTIDFRVVSVGVWPPSPSCGGCGARRRNRGPRRK